MADERGIKQLIEQRARAGGQHLVVVATHESLVRVEQHRGIVAHQPLNKTPPRTPSRSPPPRPDSDSFLEPNRPPPPSTRAGRTVRRTPKGTPLSQSVATA